MGVNNSKHSNSAADRLRENNLKSATKEEIELSTAPELPLETQTRFEGVRGPFSLKTGNISEDVLQYLLQDRFLLQPTEKLLLSGFVKANDYYVDTPGFDTTEYKKIRYRKRYKIEGFFHALPTMESVPAMQSRHGFLHAELSAPKPIKSFVRSFISKNKKFFDDITNTFPPDTTMRRLFKEGNMLSDLSIQITHGDAAGPPYIGYHVDNINSILHLALSIAGGSRTLHIGYTDPNIEKSQYTLCQERGNMYLSSPWVFRHSVQFPEQSWDERVIAIQCRTLYTPAESVAIMNEFKEGKYQRDQYEMADSIAGIMDKYTILMPTLDEVKEVENVLS